MSDDDDHSVPWWAFALLFGVIILVLASIGDDQPNNEPYVNVCSRPTAQQAC